MEILVLCIDRDDDLGRKAGIVSPVVGRAANVEATLALGLADPEDSDVNTILGGIQVYDDLASQGRAVEIASVAGDPNVGLVSDGKIAHQIDHLLERFRPQGVVVVSDGAEDEAILPIIQSRVKVEGVKRVLVKQSHNLESTYYLLKQVFRDPKISHTFFIPIGLALLIYSTFSFIGRSDFAVMAILAAVGVYLLFRGLGLDDVIDSTKETFKGDLHRRKVAFITYVLAAVLVLIATIQGSAKFWDYYTGDIWYGYIVLMMVFVYYSVWWYVAAAICVNLGQILDLYIEGVGDERAYSYPFFILAMGLIFWSASVFILVNSAGMAFPLISGQSTQYLAASAVLAILIALLGVKISRKMVERR
jgi:putative membrane protein